MDLRRDWPVEYKANLHDDLGFEVARRAELGEDPGAVFGEVYDPRMRVGDVGLQFYTVGGDVPRFCGSEELLRGVLRRIDLITEITKKRSDYQIIRAPADLDDARRRTIKALVLTLEGVLPVGYDLGVLRMLRALGLRSVCLMWFRANQVGDGVGEQRNGGLTSFGRELVMEANRLGLLVDLAQASAHTIDDVLAMTRAPVVASHCNAVSVYPHPRNLSDEHIQGIARTGGTVGVTSYPAHVGPGKPSFEDFLRHVLHIVDLVGPQHVSMGLNIIAGSFEEETRFFDRSGIDYANLWLEGLEDVTRLPSVRRSLLSQGLAPTDVDAVMGENIVRILKLAMEPSHVTPSSDNGC